ncbi:hypothetical protein Tco_0757183 [Tanacetum coccineum]
MTLTGAWKKKIWLKGLLAESGYELSLVAGIATGALVKGGSRTGRSFSDSSDLDDIAEYEMIMEINNEDQDEVEAVRMRRYINRERNVAEERLMADYFGPHPNIQRSILEDDIA